MLTLLEWSKLQADPLTSGIVEIYSSVNPVLQVMPFENIAGAAYVYNREGTLPGIAFRGINESFTESTGIINPQTESLKIAGGESYYDTFLVATGNGSNDARATHDAMKVKAMSLFWLKSYFDGSSTSDPREFDGLNARLTGGQVIDAGSGGATLTLDMVDDLVDAVIGSPSAIFCNKTMARKITKLAQSTSQVTFTQDQLGRVLTVYAGIPLYVVEEDNAGNDILAFDEDDGAGNLDTTSLYAVSFGPDRLHGIQNAPMSVRDLGELTSRPALATRVEWFSSMVAKHPKSAARLRYVNNA